MIWREWSKTACQHIYRWDAFVSAFVVGSCSLFLAVRTATIWAWSRIIVIPTSILWLAEAGLILWAAYDQKPNETVPFCISEETNQNIVVLYIAPLVFDTVMVMLVVAKALEIGKRYNSSIGPTMQFLLRDGFFYLLGIWTVNLIAVITQTQRIDPAAQPINASLATIGTSIFCSRLALATRNLRSRSVGTTWNPPSPKVQQGESPSPPPQFDSKLESGRLGRNGVRITTTSVNDSRQSLSHAHAGGPTAFSLLASSPRIMNEIGAAHEIQQARGTYNRSASSYNQTNPYLLPEDGLLDRNGAGDDIENLESRPSTSSSHLPRGYS
ncbi:hypothetical protein FA10DRAFT_267186 [Acaromyces ingoldii]|uniref:Uncharacterized protein n=1 Tax=Acaromyces ingoldii TaxID=215250 RepID=A0A316YSP3_9BASI|nr:hypothetical protein FA10DRAFT_267186 [Acaromyces ingoldii]PWN90745.1 hypothetical protein FA10DRAFT_267186 [Acaromyces ingoldii]